MWTHSFLSAAATFRSAISRPKDFFCPSSEFFVIPNLLDKVCFILLILYISSQVFLLSLERPKTSFITYVHLKTLATCLDYSALASIFFLVANSSYSLFSHPHVYVY